METTLSPTAQSVVDALRQGLARRDLYDARLHSAPDASSRRGLAVLQAMSIFVDPATAALLHEALRIDAPVQMSGRVALAPLQRGSTQVQAGERVYLHVGAANRDPSVFEAPEQFRPGRAVPHLGFGWGPTRCIGAEHALRCAAACFGALQQRFSAIAHTPEKTRFDHGLAARGLHEASFTYH